jgi:transposase
VADLVARFNRVGLAAVRIAPGRGRKSAYPLSARAQIVATAQREPDPRTDGTATWSLSTLQRALRRAGLPRVGTSTIRRVLQKAGSSYQRTRTWCPTGTARRKRKSGVVTVVDPKTEEKRNLPDRPGLPHRARNSSRSKQLPIYAARSESAPRRLDRFTLHLVHRWHEGCHVAAFLHVRAESNRPGRGRGGCQQRLTIRSPRYMDERHHAQPSRSSSTVSSRLRSRTRTTRRSPGLKSM